MKKSSVSTFVLALVGILLLFASCKSSSEVVKKEPKQKKQSTLLIEKYTSFREAVRAQSKIMVRGDEVYLRSGMQSPLRDNQVRFAVGNQILGTLVETESAIVFNEVKRINVLDAVEATSRYGIRGSNGVVEIIMFKE